MKLVLDASMALAWLFARQKTDEASCADQALLTIPKAEAWVPSLWHIEITNALLVGERRGVVSGAQVIDYLNRLSGLEIMTDSASIEIHRDLVISIAREYKLTAYNATYLELALRMNATLATFDTDLAKAMKQAGGILFQSYIV